MVTSYFGSYQKRTTTAAETTPYENMIKAGTTFGNTAKFILGSTDVFNNAALNLN